MARKELDHEILLLQDSLLTLGSLAEDAVMRALDALERRDVSQARAVMEGDEDANGRRFAIENGITTTIATQQPMAHDLRLLLAIFAVANELERMADYAKGIAKVTTLLEGVEISLPIRLYREMADKGVSMLHRALSAFVDQNYNVAASIPREDDEVDHLYLEVFNFVAREMIADASLVPYGNYLIWVAHNLERFADRVSNICERTVFIVTGDLLELEVDEGDGE